MKRTLTLMALIVALALAVACTPAANIDSGDDAGEGGAAAGSHTALVDALEMAGLEIEEDNMLLDSFFTGTTARFLMVNGQMIQVYEFASEADAEAAAETVNATGNIIGNATVDWVVPPHFYQDGRLVVVYAGEDEAILNALSGALGEPFVVGQGGFIQP